MKKIGAEKLPKVQKKSKKQKKDKEDMIPDYSHLPHYRDEFPMATDRWAPGTCFV